MIGCAYAVYNTLGAGFLESVYENAMLLELRSAGLVVESQVAMDVLYRGEKVGYFFADIVVDGILILELKAVESLSKAHEVQLVNYLTATNTDLGLLINFGADGVVVRRKVRLLSQISRKSN